MRASLGLAAAAGVLGLAVLLGSRISRHPAEPAPAWALAPPLAVARIDESRSYWAREGFLEMNAPIRPPTSLDGDVHIVVYLRLPAGAVVRARAPEGSSPGIGAVEFPPGTVADRVEYVARAGVDEPPAPGWLAADVRGTQITPDGQRFHVLRPHDSTGGGDLVGLSWPRGDPRAQDDATRAIGTLIVDGIALGPADANGRRTLATRLQALNACSDCHVASRPARRRIDDPGGVNRGTDASGFFQASTVLTDRAPLETYRPRNANGGDRFVRFVCGASETPARVDDDLRAAVHCDGGEVPLGVLDVRAGLAAGDRHTRRLCASRRLLYARLDETGQRIFADALHECDAAP